MAQCNSNTRGCNEEKCGQDACHGGKKSYQSQPHMSGV